MNIYIVVGYESYGEEAKILGAFTSEELAVKELQEFLDQSLAHSGFVQEQELIDLRM